ncbi:MAG: carboxylating nicotinate-nucleotide diphosphorylase [Bacteroidota bacterium]
MNNITIDDYIKQALLEDIGDGDVTSISCIPLNTISRANLILKEDGIIAGIDIAKRIFEIVDPFLEVEIKKSDGEELKKGEILLIVKGNARSILAAERLVLNIMQRMSGIATKTNSLARIIKDCHTKILDTRKTTPNFRLFEKMAVKIGGGCNHRFGLYDMILIKDNHIDYAGGIANAIGAANSFIKTTGKDLKIEIEARNLEEVEEIVALGNIDRIMLDNFHPGVIRMALDIINKRFETEASGNINADTILDYAKTGVDFISVGALTHSYKSLDMSLKAF